MVLISFQLQMMEILRSGTWEWVIFFILWWVTLVPPHQVHSLQEVTISALEEKTLKLWYGGQVCQAPRLKLFLVWAGQESKLNFSLQIRKSLTSSHLKMHPKRMPQQSLNMALDLTLQSLKLDKVSKMNNLISLKSRKMPQTLARHLRLLNPKFKQHLTRSSRKLN